MNFRLAVAGTATKSILQSLERAPGRKLDRRLARLSEWFNGLTPQDREMLAEAVALAAEQATYNTLLVLDGSLAIESRRTKGRLELFYVSVDGRTQLNDPDHEELSALFKDSEEGVNR